MHSAAAAVVLEKEESLMDAPSWTIMRRSGAMPLQITGSVAERCHAITHEKISPKSKSTKEEWLLFSSPLTIKDAEPFITLNLESKRNGLVNGPRL